MISIIVPLFNKEHLLKETLLSILNQTFSTFEVVIVNDGSTDNSLSVLDCFNDSRIRIINQENLGVSAARNRGIEEAKYDLIALMDADDLWESNYLEEQMNLYKNYPDCDVFITNYRYLTIKGSYTSPILRDIDLDKSSVIDNYFKIACKSSPLITSISIMVKKHALNSVANFPVGIKSGEDLLTWARLAVKYKIAFSNKVLATYRLGYSVPRPPEDFDVVGEQLELLYKQNKNIDCLNKYVAFWYKMRMCRCIAHKMYQKAIIAFFRSLKYNPFQLKIYLSIVYYYIKS